MALKESWIDAVDQYERSVLHLAALNGNTRHLINAGAHINLKDGIGQTPLTLALHMGHSNTAKYLIDYGASVCDKFYDDTIPPLEITIVEENHALIRESFRQFWFFLQIGFWSLIYGPFSNFTFYDVKS